MRQHGDYWHHVCPAEKTQKTSLRQTAGPATRRMRAHACKTIHTPYIGTYVHTSIHTCHLVHPQRRFVLARSVLYYYWAVTYRTLPTNHSTAAAARPPVYILNTCGASVQRVMVFHPITPCACPSRESSEWQGLSRAWLTLTIIMPAVQAASEKTTLQVLAEDPTGCLWRKLSILLEAAAAAAAAFLLLVLQCCSAFRWSAVCFPDLPVASQSRTPACCSADDSLFGIISLATAPLCIACSYYYSTYDSTSYHLRPTWLPYLFAPTPRLGSRRLEWAHRYPQPRLYRRTLDSSAVPRPGLWRYCFTFQGTCPRAP